MIRRLQVSLKTQSMYGQKVQKTFESQTLNMFPLLLLLLVGPASAWTVRNFYSHMTYTL